MLVLLAALGAGFRIDGAGHADAHPAPADVLWRLDLPATGNASVVGFGDMVCVTQEPTTVTCVDAATGAIRWQARHDVADAIGADDATRAAIAQAAAAQGALESLRAELGAVKRRGRSGDPDARLGAELLERRIHDQEALIAAHADQLTPQADPSLGWASPTPVTDGEHLWVMFANGVVASHARDGALAWSRWLGPRTTTMEFYPGLPTASPALAGGTLVVGYNALRGLDPATGADRWTGPAWPHYGSPTAAELDGVSVVITPAGDVVRAADGRALATGLAQDLWFNAPVVDGDVAWWVGGRYQGRAGFRNEARAVRLRVVGDAVEATTLWRAPLETGGRFYAGPAVTADKVVAFDDQGTLFALDRATGALLTRRSLGPGDQVWASPILAGDRLWVQTVDGVLVALDGDLNEVARSPRLGRTLAGAWMAGERVWIRSHAALVAL